MQYVFDVNSAQTIENIPVCARFEPKSDPKIGTVAQNIGGVGVQNSRMVEKTSEMGSLVAPRMLRNFLGQLITNIDLSSIFIDWGGGTRGGSTPSFAAQCIGPLRGKAPQARKKISFCGFVRGECAA